MSGDQNQNPVPGQPGGSWDYMPDESGGSSPPPAPAAQEPQQQPPPQEVAWTASEFIVRHKGAGWYAILAVGTVLAAALIYWLTKDVVTVGAIVAAIALFGVAAARKPRVLTYRMNESGLAIGEKFYPYGMFKSFSVVEEDAFSSIMLLPLKRFMPPISLYYDPKDEDHIVMLLAHYLPMENHSADAVDRLMRHIRF